MSDYIKRENATETFAELYDIFDDCPNIVKELHKVYDKILAIPSAEKQGEWRGEWIKEYNGNGWNDYWDYTCSECGKKYERADNILYEANFCPNCGADMRKER